MSTIGDPEQTTLPPFGSTPNSTSSGSPSLHYHISTQSQQPLGRPESPLDSNSNVHHHQLHSHSQQDSIYNFPSQPSQMYNTNTDYTSDHEQRQPHSAKINGFGSVPSASFRPPSYPAFANNTRQRHLPSSSTPMSSNAFREAPNAYFSQPNDVYTLQMTSPTPAHVPPFDPRSSYDFGAPQQSTVGSNHKYGIDPYASSGAAAASLMHHQMGSKSLPSHQQQTNGYPSQNSFSSGVLLTSQTPYGPHVPTGASSATLSGANPSGSISMPTGLNILASGDRRNEPPQEEISTIFVVGFPDDMQEREFQNMFMFSSGFEAATLKIPNKEYTSYGGAMPGAGMRPGVAGYGATYNGQNDPYNLVTVNQGGVVVDAGRDGTFASWPASAPEEGGPGAHYIGPNGINLPRKQIIGFAKFRSREEALTARDVLQGRRVDFEKGAILKAEMARKNLHTKRGVSGISGNGAGVGAEPGSVAPTGSLQQGMIGAVNGAETYGLGNGAEMSAKDRELGALGAMGLGLGSRMTQWRERLPEAAQLSGTAPGGHGRNGRVREREEEERRKERDAAIAHLNTSAFLSSSELRRPSTAYDAFHSVPLQMSRQNSQANGTNSGLLSAQQEMGISLSGGASPMIGGAFPTSSYDLGNQVSDEAAGPWDRDPSGPSDAVNAVGSHRSSSPHLTTSSNPDHPSRSFSPAPEASGQRHQHSQSGSSASSLAEGSQSGRLGNSNNTYALGAIGGERVGPAADDLTRGMAGLAVSTNAGNTSPQLPSPASGASSGGSTKNAVDQNPPINTLYVGNLPNTPSPSMPPLSLEERLRELFSARPGFSRLCFRQKNNGPMCFVEFEDIPHATKSLNDLYGDTLGGLVKGGIRLSYSKNPLGVRTPTSAGSSSGPLQHQQMQAALQQNNASISMSTESFASRFDDHTRPTILRRDPNPPPLSSASYGNSGSFMMSSPPPRFVSPTPSTTTFTAASVSAHVFVPRSGHVSLNGYSSTAFAPFGMSSPSIHEQNGDNEQQHFLHRDMTPPCNNVEAARAG